MVFDLGTMFRGEDPEGKLSNLTFCGIPKMFIITKFNNNPVNYDNINQTITLTVIPLSQFHCI